MDKVLNIVIAVVTVLLAIADKDDEKGGRPL